MAEPLGPGLALVLLAVVFQGSFMLPSKGMRGWAWENYWLLFAATAYLVCPWLLAAATIPRLFEVYATATASSLISVGIYGAGWGVGAVTFGLGVDALGLALGFALILGVSAVTGTLVPLLVDPPAHFSAEQWLLTGLGMLLMLAGVGVCSLAGKWKEKSGPERSYRRGVAICLASGLLSACGNLGFAFGADISARARALGVPASAAQNTLWTLLTLPLFLCNSGFSIYLLKRNRTAALYRSPGSARSGLLSISMGVMWMAGMGLYGMGATRLGKLGPSLGWAILMSSMVLVANLLGLLTGEWKAAPPAARRQLARGVALLMVAIAALAWANGMQAR
jgi:L-rhamnose-H+ transport protein